MAQVSRLTARIDRPVERVWSWLTDWSHLQEWVAGVESVHKPADTSTGATITYHARGQKRTSTVADCRISGAWRLVSGPIRAAIRRTDSGQLNALKRAVEAGGDRV